MIPVTLLRKKENSGKRKLVFGILAAFLWLAVWTAAAAIIDRPLFLPGPVSVLTCFFSLAVTGNFWSCVGFSIGNILMGYFFGAITGIVLSWISYQSDICEAIISLPLKIIRTVPVASFIILALLWVSSKHLSILISFLMVVPVVYANALSGLKNTDVKLIEMADVFHMPASKRIVKIYFPSLMPHLSSALCTAAGFAWKSGIAAEVIGITRNSVGNRLYQSKIYLETEELFAWTLTVIIISLMFEKLLTVLIGRRKKIK